MLRGLVLRVDYAKAKNAFHYHPTAGNHEHLLSVLLSAEQMGHTDGRQGVEQPPVLFQDEPALVNHWHTGHAEGVWTAELANCCLCRDSTGNPCVVHG